jgi:hypothetical protein
MSQVFNGAQANDRWSEKKAYQWYQKQAWLVGANFLPSNAINQLEMWQASQKVLKSFPRKGLVQAT